ncbi:sugar translocase [Alphaproteobacteria bacterium]|nr:sugar translocase [Alphaproteobacteria bacterium]
MEKLKSLANNKVARFVLVGGTATVIDFGILNLLNFLGLDTLVANTLSTGLAMVFSFFMNKKYTFQSDAKNYAREVTLFIIFTLFGLWVIQNGIIQLLLLIDVDLPDFVRLNGAKIIATLFSMTWNYVTYNKIVFRKKSPQKTSPAASE